ncbi:hypothetical protein P170DRAFT_457119 [Aspergillus steynii IBT 23096]|uniref:Zn(2)-C6 fungal-type domain-containing protein n=1 Tax=Aspergillus steynii IBT 23096 TaxID=1392250 RepID=A0A2I2G0V7_9EURO|nr:uncharacterized protein P170DRAFT_457119 [Aspergillus steynii IBT 23096]PLB46509.1 hypothetical protein P170DRAFT_457119 [Aspergillus steynii IBT 23096]
MPPSVRSSAGYGHACMACAQAKCRCLPRGSGGKCQRCNRLNKECVQSQRKRTPKPLSRTAQLEQKVDGLLSLLSASTSVDESGARRATGLEQNVQQSLSADLANPRTHSSSGFTPTESPQGNSEVDRIGYEDTLLTSFRTKKLPCFPFVHIPDTTSAQKFKQESPYLWRCIEVTESRNVDALDDFTTRLRREISNAVLVELEKSLDLLQAILAYLAWITYESFPMKSSLCMYCQLACGLIIELGLTTAPPGETGLATFTQICAGQGQLQHLRPRLSETRTMNERRAVLSFFVLSSMISQYLGRMDPLRWTPHLTDCLDVLSTNSETPNDAVLVQLTRARLLAGKMSDGPWNDTMLSEDRFPRAPSSFYLSALQTHLERTRAEIPTDLQNNKPILFHIYHTEVSLYDPILFKPTTADDDLKRLDYLYACLFAVRRFFHLVLSIPCTDFASFPLTHIIQIAHCFISLFRLSTLDFPGWDKPNVRRTADIISIAHQAAEKWIQVADVENNSLHRNAYTGLGPDHGPIAPNKIVY